MPDQKTKIELYALSTCRWCHKCKAWLDDRRFDYKLTYMDRISGQEKEDAKSRILSFTPRLSFPVMIVDDGREVIQGYKPDKFCEVLE